MQFLNEWLINEQRQVEQQQIIQQLQMNAAPAVYGSLGSQGDLNAQLQAMRMSSEGSHASLPINLNGTVLSNLNGSIGVASPVLTQQTVMAIQNLPRRQLTQRDMLDSHVMMPLDLLNDDRNLFSIMPYCTGGELFEILEKKNRKCPRLCVSLLHSALTRIIETIQGFRKPRLASGLGKR